MKQKLKLWILSILFEISFFFRNGHFQCCLTSKYTTLIRRGKFQRWNNNVALRRWFDVNPRRDAISTKTQRWNIVETFAGSTLRNIVDFFNFN